MRIVSLLVVRLPQTEAPSCCGQTTSTYAGTSMDRRFVGASQRPVLRAGLRARETSKKACQRRAKSRRGSAPDVAAAKPHANRMPGMGCLHVQALCEARNFYHAARELLRGIQRNMAEFYAASASILFALSSLLLLLINTNAILF